MIADNDRSFWFGASDARFIMGNWKTKTFSRWWLQKIGLKNDHFSNDATSAGTYFEHPILDFIGAEEKDKQILIPEYRIRVNLDGNTGNHIFEVKTHKDENFKPTKAYIQQCNVQMFAMGEDSTCEIIAYRLTEDDYKNFFREIEKDRVTRHPINRDEEFIKKFLSRTLYLKFCMEGGLFPDENQYGILQMDGKF